MAGHGAAYLEHSLHGGTGDTPPRAMRLWSVAHKIDGKYLSPWLAGFEDEDATAPVIDHAGDLTIDVALPAAAVAVPAT
jgi:sulfide:quinone oxidoreductase